MSAEPARTGPMKLRLTLALAAVTLAAAAPHRPQRIVSRNLCADQLLLELADRVQIAALTRNAADPFWSAAAAKARGIKRLGGSAEELVGLQPDLVIGYEGAAPPPGGARFLGLGSAESYAEIVAQIRGVASAVGHPARGEAMIARMDRALAALPRARSGATAAYYQRRGYLTGTGTLIDDLMDRVGLVNLAARLDRPPLSPVSIEEMVAFRPDYLIVESSTVRVRDQGTEMLHHPALAAIPRLRLPQAWTVCGGPAYVAAARSLAEQMARR